MKEGQNDIYNITGETVAAVSSSPFLEALRKKGLEVLYVFLFCFANIVDHCPRFLFYVP